MAMKYWPKRMDEKGQLGLESVLSLIIILFVIFTVGRILFNGTLLDPDSADGGINATGNGYTPQVNSLTNIGLITMFGIVLISAMASIVLRFF